MADIDGPRRARPDEFPELLDLIDRCFRQRRGGMADRLPFVYNAGHPERHAIVRQDGEVVAHAAAIPQTFAVGGGEVACAGIGGVATDPRYRGNGHMSALLEFWLEECDDPLFELGGDRVRYGRYGWENGGQEFRYRITSRTLPDSLPDLEVSAYDGSDEQLAFLRGLHAEEPYRVKRSPSQSARVYDRTDTETLLTTGPDPAYLSVDRTSSDATVREFGGSARGIEGVLGKAFDRLALDAVTVFTPPGHELNPTFRQASAGWQQTPFRKLNIRDLEGALSGFAPQMARRLGDRGVSPTSVTLGIAGDDDPVRIQYDGERVTVERTDDEPTVSLDRRELVLLLFSYREHLSDLRDRHPLLDAVCPLTYYIWPAERV